MNHKTPLEALRHHVSGAIERGEAVAIVAKDTTPAASASWHTPGELWIAYGQAYTGNGIDKQLGILLADRNEPRTMPTERDANIERAVQCWNACAGMSDPAAGIAARDAEIQHLRYVLNRLSAAYSEADGLLWQQARAALATGREQL